jgi:hypothetical protein
LASDRPNHAGSRLETLWPALDAALHSQRLSATSAPPQSRPARTSHSQEWFVLISALIAPRGKLSGYRGARSASNDICSRQDTR